MTRVHAGLLTASMAVACGCAGFDPRALMPAVVLRAAVDRRGRAGPTAGKEGWEGRIEAGLTWSDLAPRRADALEPAPEAVAEDDPGPAARARRRGVPAIVLASTLLATGLL